MITLCRGSRIAAIVLAAFAVGCYGGAPPTHWYAVGSDYAVYLAWTEVASGNLQGQVQVVSVDPSDPTKLKSVNEAFTGTRNGSDVSIAFPLLSSYGGTTWTGTLRGNSLSLVIPTGGLPSNLSLLAGSFSDFQVAANKIQQSVDRAQQKQAAYQAAVAQRQAAYDSVADALGRLRDAYAEARNSLAAIDKMLPVTPRRRSLRTQYAVEWAKMRHTWAQEQAAAQVSPMTCYQKSTVIYVAGEVDYELGEINYLDGESQSLLQEIQSTVSAAKDGVLGVQKWAPLYYQRSRAYAQITGQPSSGNDPGPAAQAFADAANSSLEAYSQRVMSFEQTISDYDARARALDQRARRFPNSITCSD
ncbi:MAG: hypothetical protein ACYDGM_14130 [Vulcanimicrobiaceae bacterium]